MLKTSSDIRIQLDVACKQFFLSSKPNRTILGRFVGFWRWIFVFFSSEKNALFLRKVHYFVTSISGDCLGHFRCPIAYSNHKVDIFMKSTFWHMRPNLYLVSYSGIHVVLAGKHFPHQNQACQSSWLHVEFVSCAKKFFQWKYACKLSDNENDPCNRQKNFRQRILTFVNLLKCMDYGDLSSGSTLACSFFAHKNSWIFLIKIFWFTNE